ncbi:hypothetical protein [Spirosoma koreense]
MNSSLWPFRIRTYRANNLARKPVQVVLTLLAACFFFLSMSSVALGIIGLLQHISRGAWWLGGGVVMQFVAVSIALLAERK